MKLENGTIRTLREWISELQITPVKYTFTDTGNTYDMYKSKVKQDRNGFIDIFTRGGYGLHHADIDRYLDFDFFIQNADIHDIKLTEKFW